MAARLPTPAMRSPAAGGAGRYRERLPRRVHLPYVGQPIPPDVDQAASRGLEHLLDAEPAHEGFPLAGILAATDDVDRAPIAAMQQPLELRAAADQRRIGVNVD